MEKKLLLWCWKIAYFLEGHIPNMNPIREAIHERLMRDISRNDMDVATSVRSNQAQQLINTLCTNTTPHEAHLFPFDGDKLWMNIFNNITLQPSVRGPGGWNIADMGIGDERIIRLIPWDDTRRYPDIFCRKYH
jgi:hypothetical protein